ncbi:MAG TPA: M20/M25/M40 family metallo-hydrolase [Caldilineae bacterium]|nr:M20/M25/M40 family metallo-hydrolase [Caldilineae bacterium]
MNAIDHIETDRILTMFLELVQIDSPSGQEAEIGKHLMSTLQDLGCNVRRDGHGNLIACYPGQGDEIVLLSCHMDTVGTDTGIKPVIRDGVVYSDGTTILGADDKAGIAVLLETLKVFREQPDLQHPPLEIVISVSEEKGLVGAKKLDKSQLQADWGIVLDSGGPIGTLVYTGPSQNHIDAVVHGKKAHAGSAPEKGINAIVVASEAIATMPVGRIDEETTSNVGIIQGGEATNIVPDIVTVNCEARSRNDEKLAAQTETMVKAFEDAAAKYGATVDVEVRLAYQGYLLTPDQRPYAVAARAIESLGFELIPKKGGGGTDGHIYTAAGIPCVVLSAGMADVHTSSEHVAIQDMVDSAKVLIQALTQSVSAT